MKKLQTVCLHYEQEFRTTKSHQLPIYPTSSFELGSVEEGMAIFKDPMQGHLYGRFSNPTIDTVAAKIAELETYDTGIQQPWGIMTSSGMSAITTLLMAELKSGDKILTQGNLYGGSTELILKKMPDYGIEVVLADLTDADQVKEALTSDPSIKLIYFETPSNPSLDCVDLEVISKVAKGHDVITAVDNTFCSPVIQRPMSLGIDYVIHSTTKYINGHGNGISGIIIGAGDDRKRKIWSTMKLLGTNSNAFDAWLTYNGLKTLPLRMEKHSSNALALAKHLADHHRIKTVGYLGLTDHKYHSIAKKQMAHFGGMLCFELDGSYDQVITLMNNLRLPSLAPTMGDIDTLIMHPASMSHLNVDPTLRKEHGISDALVRVSVGIEDIHDLTDDFDRAISSL